MAVHPRLQRLLWMGLLLAAGAVIAVQGARLLVIIQAGAATTSDFCQDYQTAGHWLHGAHIYAPVNCWSRYSSTAQPLEYDTHPPPSLLLFAPFVPLSYSTAAWLWGLLNLACLMLSLVIICRELDLWRLQTLLPILALFLLWEPTLDSTRSGNVGAGLSCLLIALAWRALRRGQQGHAGMLSGLALLLKPLPFLLLPYFLLRRQWRAAVSMAASLALGVVLSLALMGVQTWADYLGPVRLNESPDVPVPGNLSLAGLVTRWGAGYHEFLHPGASRAFIDLPPLLPHISLDAALLLGDLLAGAVALTLGFRLWRRVAGDNTANAPAGGWNTSDDASFAFVLVLSFLVFPLSWQWNLVVLAMPLLWLAVKVWRSGNYKARWRYGAALLLLALPFGWSIPAFQVEAQTALPWPVRLVGAILTALPSVALGLLLSALWPWLLRTDLSPTGESAIGPAIGARRHPKSKAAPSSPN